MSDAPNPTARVKAIRDDIVTVALDSLEEGGFVPVLKNEVVLICPRRKPASHRQEALKAEVLRVRLGEADVQVFESTKGVSIGDPVVQTGEMLCVQLGPGLLGQVYDGLQNPLETTAIAAGTFLPRGLDLPGLNPKTRWAFEPCVSVGDTVLASAPLGHVQEGRFRHTIMAPFDMVGEGIVTWVQAGDCHVNSSVVRLSTAKGERDITLNQRWPVRVPIPQGLMRSHLTERQYPREPLLTGIRLIDGFFPIAKGGTACIPGPFGAGKTVLQGLIARFAKVDVVVIVACGERAGEVVETIHEFPALPDPNGGTLMDRTIIICNTSSMPVAAREASVYTGITLCEYYRQMGMDVLMIADSTSRWAQAMRETSGRLEEIPGEEAFPAYLDSSIRALYERAGVITNQQAEQGSLTMIGTVSPAGGNFEEPVTQSTLRSVKTFLGLSSERAYQRAYPAVDPSVSWSRYHDQLSAWFDAAVGEQWQTDLTEAKRWVSEAKAIENRMQVTGEEGIPLKDYAQYQKAFMLDKVFLQQDAFDSVDASTPLERQKALLGMIMQLARQQPTLDSRDAIRNWYVKVTGALKNWNYTSKEEPEYHHIEAQITQFMNG
jgi:V/A-type H+-transporting ATPase subunit A